VDPLGWHAAGGQPNAGARRYPYTDGNGNPAGPDPLVVADLPAARAALRDWLRTTLRALGLPEPALGQPGLPPEVHLTVRRDSASHPVFHFVNYAMAAVAVPWMDGDRAGANNFVNRTAWFGCTAPQTLTDLTLPVPADLQATGGRFKVVSLDYRPPQESFFPNQSSPSVPCSQPALGDSYPSPLNGYAYPSWTTSFAAGATSVTLPQAKMKQWMIGWFEPP
jgi:hypothetical protein